MAKIAHTYHDNGRVAAEAPEIDGIPHGIVRHWHPNGVLAMEIPMDHGTIDGTVNQWNDKGELIATSELKKGTGVLRTLHPEQGLDGEMTYIDGKLTGRQLCYCGGQLLAVVYWLDNNKVSKKRYLEACKQNPKLPRYQNEPRNRVKSPSPLKIVKPSGLPSQATDELPLKLLQGPRVQEALSWLEESRQPSRSLGEAIGQDESIRLVKKLLGLGAVAVKAVEIDGGPTEDQNTGRLVIELPKNRKERTKLLKFCGKMAHDAGFDAEPDFGQRYVLLMLD